MDKASMLRIRSRFDVALAELDVKVAPDGIDRKEVARERYAEFVEAGLAAGLFEVEPTVALMARPESAASEIDAEDDDGDDGDDGDDDGDDDDDDEGGDGDGDDDADADAED